MNQAFRKKKKKVEEIVNLTHLKEHLYGAKTLPLHENEFIETVWEQHQATLSEQKNKLLGAKFLRLREAMLLLEKIDKRRFQLAMEKSGYFDSQIKAPLQHPE